MKPGDRVTWLGWGRVARGANINCKGRIIKILSDNGWAIVKKFSGSWHYVPVKNLKKLD